MIEDNKLSKNINIQKQQMGGFWFLCIFLSLELTDKDDYAELNDICGYSSTVTTQCPNPCLILTILYMVSRLVQQWDRGAPIRSKLVPVHKQPMEKHHTAVTQIFGPKFQNFGWKLKQNLAFFNFFIGLRFGGHYAYVQRPTGLLLSSLLRRKPRVKISRFWKH